MVDEVPSPGGITGPSGFQAHDWYSYDSYLNIHYAHMDRLSREGIVLRDGLSILPTRDGRALVKVNIEGSIVCCDNVVIQVDKWLVARPNRVRRHPEVKGSSYSYHAQLTSGQHLVRFCTAHGLNDLHVHRFDLRTGIQIDEPRIPLHELPTLDDFITQSVELGRKAQRPNA